MWLQKKLLFWNKNHVETQNFASLQNKYKPSNLNLNKFGTQSQNLASIIRGFKSAVKKYAVIHNINFHWQSRFYDHIIRNEKSLNKIRQYIKNNPLKWEVDEENPKNIVKYKLNGKTSCRSDTTEDFGRVCWSRTFIGQRETDKKNA